MEHVPVTRAAHLNEFCDLFRQIGIPVETELHRNKLPQYLEETPDALINNILATGFVGRTAAREGIEDIGWMAACIFSDSQLSGEITAALACEPTVFGRLKRFMELSAIEDSHLRLNLIATGSTVCVMSDMAIPDDTPGMDASNWTQIAVVLDVIRSVTGPAWTPSHMTFKTQFSPCWEACQAFADTGIQTGAANTAIFFPRETLAARIPVSPPPASRPAAPAFAGTELEWIKSLLVPYLRDHVPSVADAADILGLSVRTLQRRLRSLDTSYRALTEQMRFELAADRLISSDAPIIEIAFELGFEDQSNFGRMFRRYSGISPSAYRKRCA